MTDLETAVKTLPGHTLVLCLDGNVQTSDLRGVTPMVDWLENGADLRGYSAADKVVGRAAAMLFIVAGVVAVYAETMSLAAEELLHRYGIATFCGERTDRIRNRDRTDICPMEKAVADTEDVTEGVARICAKLKELRGERP